jgi:hypothetical protein
MLSTVPCGLSRPHKLDFLVLFTPSRVKWASPVNKTLRITCRLELIQRIWYGYTPSVNSFRQTLMRGIRRRAEIVFVLVRGLRCTMSIMCSSSSTFRGTWHSAWRFTLGKETFLADVDVKKWTHVCQSFVVEDIVADILRHHQWCYSCKPRTRNAYRHTLRRKITCLHLLLTAKLSQHKTTAQFAIRRNTLWASATLQQLLTPCYRKQKFHNMTPRARTGMDYRPADRDV